MGITVTSKPGKGMILSGLASDGSMVEVVELPDHPLFVGCQYHPSSNRVRSIRIRSFSRL